MGTDSGIDYVQHSLNFWRGCTKVDECCDNCYAERDAKRRGWDFSKVLRCANQIWHQPLVIDRKTQKPKWRAGSRVFICSISDFFHPDADRWRENAWGVILSRPDLIWIIVTKRIERAEECLPGYFTQGNYPNLMIMPTCGTRKMADTRIPIALELKTKYPWIKIGVSIEPMLGEIKLNPLVFGYTKPTGQFRTHKGKRQIALKYSKKSPALDWVIVGGESGAGMRYCPVENIRSIVNQCKSAGVPVFVKQLHLWTVGSGIERKLCETEKDARQWAYPGKPKLILSKDISEWPEDLRVQEYPIRKG